jgi:hypothetical protein
VPQQSNARLGDVTDRRPAMVKVLDRSQTTGMTRLVLVAIASYSDPDGKGRGRRSAG